MGALVNNNNGTGTPIQGFAPKEVVSVADGETITFKSGSIFMNEAEGSFTFNGGSDGFYLQPNITLVAAQGGMALTPQGAGARFLVTGEYTIA